MWRRRSLRPLLILLLAGTVLGAGASPGHAAPTRTVPPKYNYDYPPTFAPDSSGSPLRERGLSPGWGARFQADLAARRLVRRPGVAAEEGRTLFHYTSEASEAGIRKSGKINPSLEPPSAR